MMTLMIISLIVFCLAGFCQKTTEKTVILADFAGVGGGKCLIFSVLRPIAPYFSQNINLQKHQRWLRRFHLARQGGVGYS
jgi:hypothetical protein